MEIIINMLVEIFCLINLIFVEQSVVFTYWFL